MQGKAFFVLDGYNVIHLVPELERHLSESLAAARDGLVSYCAEWLDVRRDVGQFTVVFDGDSSVLGAPSRAASSVRLIYTQTDETADSRIVQIVEREAPHCQCTVVSADKAVVRGVRSLGAATLSPLEFYGVLHKPRSKRRGGTIRSDVEAPLSPALVRQVNEELKKVWGITD